MDRGALPCLSSDTFFGTMSKRKMSGYFGSQEAKPIDQEEEKLKRNSHTRKNREKKMMLNFRIRIQAFSRRNGCMITSGYSTKIMRCFDTFAGCRKRKSILGRQVYIYLNCALDNKFGHYSGIKVLHLVKIYKL